MDLQNQQNPSNQQAPQTGSTTQPQQPQQPQQVSGSSELEQALQRILNAQNAQNPPTTPSNSTLAATQQVQGNAQIAKAPAQSAQQSIPQVSTPANTDVMGFEVSAGSKAAVQLLHGLGADTNALMNLVQTSIQEQKPLDLTAFQTQFGNNATYALQAAQALVADSNAYVERAQRQAYAKVGGKEQWEQLTNAFKQQAPHMREAVQQLIQNNQMDAAIALMRSVVPAGQYQQATPMQGALIQPVQTQAQGLTKTQFIMAVQELRKQYPNQSFEMGLPAQLYRELVKRREQAIQAGVN